MLQEASGHDKDFEKKLLEAYQQTCVPHLAVLRTDPSMVKRKVLSEFPTNSWEGDG